MFHVKDPKFKILYNNTHIRKSALLTYIYTDRVHKHLYLPYSKICPWQMQGLLLIFQNFFHNQSSLNLCNVWILITWEHTTLGRHTCLGYWWMKIFNMGNKIWKAWNFFLFLNNIHTTEIIAFNLSYLKQHRPYTRGSHSLSMVTYNSTTCMRACQFQEELTNRKCTISFICWLTISYEMIVNDQERYVSQ